MALRRGTSGRVKSGPDVIGVITKWEYQVSGDGAIVNVAFDESRSNGFLLNKRRDLVAELDEVSEGRTRVRTLSGGVLFGEDLIFEQKGEAV